MLDSLGLRFAIPWAVVTAFAALSGFGQTFIQADVDAWMRLAVLLGLGLLGWAMRAVYKGVVDRVTRIAKRMEQLEEHQAKLESAFDTVIKVIGRETGQSLPRPFPRRKTGSDT